MQKKIKIHANPFFVDKDKYYQEHYNEAFGVLPSVHNILDDIAEYICDRN